LIDAVVHAVNEDYMEMARDFTRLGFLSPGTDVTPIVPALEAIWQNSTGKGLADFNFRTVTGACRKHLFHFHSSFFKIVEENFKQPIYDIGVYQIQGTNLESHGSSEVELPKTGIVLGGMTFLALDIQCTLPLWST
jgi:hypothetical protein